MERPTYGYGAPDENPQEQPEPSPFRSDESSAAQTPPWPAASESAAPQPAAADPSAPSPAQPFPTQRRRPEYGQPSEHAPQPVPTSPDGQPVCPRHTDRVAYVRCQRCELPACPECQRAAAVGVRCVDCDRELARRQAGSAPRNAMGGGIASHTPVVTYTLLGLFFLGQLVSGGLVETLAIFGPYRALAMPWTFISAGFVHGGIMHLLLNGWALWAIGGYMEQALGRWRYLGLFLVSVIAGHVTVLLFADPASTSWVTHTLGASGGVFGLFGSLFIAQRKMGAEAGQVVVLIVLNLVITFTVPGISWEGHLGGLVLGTAMTAAMFALRPTARPGDDRVALARKSALMHAGVLAGGLVLCLVLIAIKAAAVGPEAFATW